MSFVFFILILVVLILVHEFGHFIVAKKLGIKVIEFSIGFPPRIGKIRWRGTDFSFGMLLLGGYVRLLGENEIEDGKEDEGSLRSRPDSDLRDPSSVDRSQNFAFASGWKQAVITLAGVGMNFLFAWLAFIVVFMAGLQVNADTAAYPQYLSDPAVFVQDVAAGSPAAGAGILPGDVVMGMQSGTDALEGTFGSAEFQEFTSLHPDSEIMLTVRRGEEIKEMAVTPATGIVPERAVIGVGLADLAVQRLPVHLAIVTGTQSFWDATAATAVGLGMFAASLIQGQGNFADVAGPVGIAKMGAESVSLGFSMALLFAAIISINLAILNLLPIPGLDGGRLLFIIIERIKGSAINPKVAARIMIVGFALLALLMIAVTYHDIVRLF